MFDDNEPPKKRSFTLSRFIILMLAAAAILYLFAGEGRALWQPNTNPGRATPDPNISDSADNPLVYMIPADFARVVEQVKPAVVRIVAKKVDYWYLQPVPTEGMGTGFIIDPSGYILTNRHVVLDANAVDVYLSDGSRHPADVMNTPETTDLALLKISGRTDFPSVRFLSAERQITPYQWVVAIGYPYDIGGGPTVSEGIISAVGRSIQLEDGTVLKNLLQSTAATNPGNSGGPLLNLSGEVVGINTAMIKGAENIGFAISRDTIVDYVNSLKKK